MQKDSDFPEFYRRFEREANAKDVKEFAQIEMMIANYAGKKWYPTQKQSLALAKEAEKRGIKNIYVTEWVEKQPKRKQLTARARYGKRYVRTGVSGTAKKEHKLSVRALKVLVIHNYVKKGYSANKIQHELKAQGKGIRRKELLKIVREVKKMELKKDSNKYTRKKYRKW